MKKLYNKCILKQSKGGGEGRGGEGEDTEVGRVCS